MKPMIEANIHYQIMGSLVEFPYIIECSRSKLTEISYTQTMYYVIPLQVRNPELFVNLTSKATKETWTLVEDVNTQRSINLDELLLLLTLYGFTYKEY